MIKEKKIAIIEFTVIVLLWALVVITPLLFMSDFNQNWKSIHVMWVECAVIGSIFLINRFFLMPHLFFKKKYTLYITSLALLFIILSIFILYFDGVNKILSLFIEGRSEYTIQPTMNRALPRYLQSIPPPHNTPLIPPMIGILILSAIVIALDMGLSIAMRWVLSEKKRAEIDREKTQAQLTNLQNQISPHFFMNTLNNIYAMVKMGSPKAAESVMELSGLMDYLLYESSNSKSVSLKRELEFIQSYVNLMRLRYPERVVIEFNISDNIPSVKIAPLLALNFIENAFKYGVNYTKESFIRIDFRANEQEIIISVANSNHSDTVKCSRRGLGILNSRKRLDLIYGEYYILEISEREDIYSVTLKIPTSL